MSDQGYNDGLSGGPFQAGTNYERYQQGVKDREYAERTWGAPAPKKVDVPGVAYTLILTAPFIYLVYPVLGVTLLAVFAAVVFVFWMTALPAPIEILAGLLLCVAAFFPGLKLEAMASQLRPYRAWRTAQRLIMIPAAGVGLASGVDFQDFSRFEFKLPPPEVFLASLIAAIIVHFVFRTLDRLYFPVWAQVEKDAAMQAANVPSRRSMVKRALYSLLWLIPVVLVLNLTIRLIVGVLVVDVAAFYDEYSAFVYGLDIALWLVLCLAGILPGTSKYRKRFVDPEILLERR